MMTGGVNIIILELFIVLTLCLSSMLEFKVTKDHAGQHPMFTVPLQSHDPHSFLIRKIALVGLDV
jgi:hypothetical protein